MQYQNLNEFKDLGDNQDEFQSNYLSVTNTELPCYNQRETNFYSGAAISYALKTNPKDFTKNYQEAITTLLNQCTPEVRSKFITVIQQKIHADIKLE